MIKTINEMRTKGETLFMNVIYKTPTEDTRLNGERLDAISLRSETTQGCSLSPLLFNKVFRQGNTVIKITRDPD
jgi:hypothetical protein